MFTSRPLRTSAALAAVVLALAACGAPEDGSPSASSDGGGFEVTQPAQEAPAESTDDGEETGTGAGEGSAPSEQESDDAAGQEVGALTITLDGEETAFSPEIVRCNGEPGTIRNVVMTMEDDELPLIEVTLGDFAMVKLDHRGEPERTSSPKDITAEGEQVSFDNATIGGATVDGTVTCLQGNRG
jgi:hypothetical protein